MRDIPAPSGWLGHAARVMVVPLLECCCRGLGRDIVPAVRGSAREQPPVATVLIKPSFNGNEASVW